MMMVIKMIMAMIMRMMVKGFASSISLQESSHYLLAYSRDSQGRFDHTFDHSVC